MKTIKDFKQFELKALKQIKGGDNGISSALQNYINTQIGFNIQVYGGGSSSQNPLAAAASLSGSEVIFNAVDPTGNTGAHESSHVVQVKHGTNP
jgi:hypothetical protein